VETVIGGASWQERFDQASTQKPAAHFCGRVLGVTIHFEHNTMLHWTSQPKRGFLFHSRARLTPTPTFRRQRATVRQFLPKRSSKYFPRVERSVVGPSSA
jgi:hypothetical protein